MRKGFSRARELPPYPFRMGDAILPTLADGTDLWRGWAQSRVPCRCLYMGLTPVHPTVWGGSPEQPGGAEAGRGARRSAAAAWPLCCCPVWIGVPLGKRKGFLALRFRMHSLLPREGTAQNTGPPASWGFCQQAGGPKSPGRWCQCSCGCDWGAH